MAAGEGGERGLSAAQARGVTKRVKRGRLIAEPAKYNIKDGEKIHEGLRFKQVQELCPKVTTSTLMRRLEKGERDLKDLRRKPAPKSMPKFNYGKPKS